MSDDTRKKHLTIFPAHTPDRGVCYCVFVCDRDHPVKLQPVYFDTEALFG
jgi:hypothetical protein